MYLDDRDWIYEQQVQSTYSKLFEPGSKYNERSTFVAKKEWIFNV